MRSSTAARRVPVLLAALGGALLGLVPVVSADASSAAVPAGYQLAASESLGSGVEHWTLRHEDPGLDVHVARLPAGMGRQLVPAVANDVLTGPASGLDPTSSICSRVKCVAAVNGDFWDPNGQPIGAMVAAGELITTPTIDHVLLRLDGQGRATVRPGIDWGVAIRTADGRSQAVGAVNRALSGEEITLYSARWGPATSTDPDVVELVLELVLPSSPVLPSGETMVRVSAPRPGGNAPLAPGQVVLAGRGAAADALTALAERAARFGGIAVLDVRLGGVTSAIGGSPQLLRGQALAYPTENRDGFTQNRHARTMVGITASGEILLVTADRSPASVGLTLREAADLMAGLGAVDAINLDGGGSTTFVVGGAVRNQPGEGQQRPVASALVLVPSGADPLSALLNSLLGSLNSLLQPK